MAIAKLSHKKRNYLLCASIAGLMVIWNSFLIVGVAVAPLSIFDSIMSDGGVEKIIVILFLVILIVDIFCIIKLSTKITILKFNPDENHGTLALVTLGLAFLPTIISCLILPSLMR